LWQRFINKITRRDVGMKNIILPLCPLWFFESLITGGNKKLNKVLAD
jgi:hypothetical protein